MVNAMPLLWPGRRWNTSSICKVFPTSRNIQRSVILFDTVVGSDMDDEVDRYKRMERVYMGRMLYQRQQSVAGLDFQMEIQVWTGQQTAAFIGNDAQCAIEQSSSRNNHHHHHHHAQRVTISEGVVLSYFLESMFMYRFDGNESQVQILERSHYEHHHQGVAINFSLHLHERAHQQCYSESMRSGLHSVLFDQMEDCVRSKCIFLKSFSTLEF